MHLGAFQTFSLRPDTIKKKHYSTVFFPVNFAKCLKIPYLRDTFKRLALKKSIRFHEVRICNIVLGGFFDILLKMSNKVNHCFISFFQSSYERSET